MRDHRLDGLPVAIIGAGPIGLAAAANLVERGIDFVIYEAGDSIASSMRSWGHIRLFSPWKHLIDPAARRLLEADGWTAAALPGQGSDRRRARRAVPRAAGRARPDRLAHPHRRHRGRRDPRGHGPHPHRRTAPTPLSLLRITDCDGAVSEVTARAVIDASGTYRTPNSLGSNGLDPLGLDEVADHVTHALPDVLGADRKRFAGKHITVVGAGHSAANTLHQPGRPSSRPSRHDRHLGRSATRAPCACSPPTTTSSPDRASLGAKVQKLVDFGVIEVVDRFEIIGLARQDERVDVAGLRNGGVEHITTDLIVNATGFRPDLGMLREVRLDLDEIVEAPVKLAPLIDPNVHSCGTVEPHGFAELQQPEPNFFIAGMKSYGRAPTFLLATGYEQVRSITAYLAGDLAAATNVELVLPATGVCSTEPMRRAAPVCLLLLVADSARIDFDLCFRRPVACVDRDVARRRRTRRPQPARDGRPDPRADPEPDRRVAGRATAGHRTRGRARTPQPTVSHHLRLMTDEGLLERVQEGRQVWYSVVPSRVNDVFDSVRADPVAAAVAPPVLDRIADDLAARFAGTFSPETVAEYVHGSYGLLAERARITRYLPSLTARFAADRLRALAEADGLSTDGVPDVLFVCVQNAGRSQLASAILRSLAGDRVRVLTAGSEPAASINPKIVAALDEIGVPLGGEYPKPLTDEVVRAADYVITMGCGDACPIYPGRRYLDWDLPDPAALPHGWRACGARRHRRARARAARRDRLGERCVNSTCMARSTHR